MAMPENIRILLKSNYDRIENLGNINHATLGFTVAFFGGLLLILINIETICDGSDKRLLYAVIVVASIFELFLWRVYSNYIDNSIIDCYDKIIYCEKRLQIPEEITLKKSLMKQCEPLKWLIDRGHGFFDVITYVFAWGIIFYYLFFVVDFRSFSYFPEWILIFSLMIIVGFLVIFYCKWRKNFKILKIICPKQLNLS